MIPISKYELMGGIVFFICLFPVALRPNAGHGLLIHEVSRSHTTMHHSRQDSSGRVISSSQRPLPDNTQHSQQTNIPCPRWDSNPRSQQACGRWDRQLFSLPSSILLLDSLFKQCLCFVLKDDKIDGQKRKGTETKPCDITRRLSGAKI